MDQQGQFWQSDAQPNADFTLSSNGPDGEALDADGETVAVAISVSADLAGDLHRHLEHRTHKIRSILFVRPTRNLDRHCLRDAGDAVALADEVKTMMREFAKRQGAKRVLLYYLGPLSGACFIGHRLNAVCREVQIMEWSDPKYVPSFTLT
ncbi:MAG: SAVED domain-containing protein [Armatimonadaceae bacterium]